MGSLQGHVQKSTCRPTDARVFFNAWFFTNRGKGRICVHFLPLSFLLGQKNHTVKPGHSQ